MTNELLRVLIVEDEHLVIGLLKLCIDWEAKGFEIVGECSNGIDALKVVDQIKPDIIITDINMPRMDGLEFSRLVLEGHPQIRIIVLTGHDKLEYVKKSMKIGIIDFLLKPINDEEISKTLTVTRNRILEERAKSNQYHRIKDELEQNLPVIREKFFNDLIYNTLDGFKINERAAYLGMSFANNVFQVAVVKVFTPETGAKLGVDQQKSLLSQCLELVTRFFETDPRIFVFRDHNHQVVVLCNNMAGMAQERCEDLKAGLIKTLRCDIAIGIGVRHDALEQAGEAYREACQALSCQFAVGKNKVIEFTDRCGAQAEQSNRDHNFMEEFGIYLKAGLSDEAEQVIDLVFQDLTAQMASEERIRVVACNFIAALFNVLRESGIKQEEVFTESAQSFESIFKMDTGAAIKKYLQKITAVVSRSFFDLQGKKPHKIVQEVTDYVYEHFSETDITLSQVAKKYYLNLSYLSRIFKQEAGLNFVEFLTKVRMEKAFKLLQETDLKVYQIAERVGINDAHYFSICFKKYTGMSINAYRKKVIPQKND
jgi:two-component system response regulator YesN